MFPYSILYLFYACTQLNTGQTDGAVGKDLHLEPVWRQGITGSGVVVTVVDEGESRIRLPYVAGRDEVCSCVFLIVGNITYN